MGNSVCRIPVNKTPSLFYRQVETGTVAIPDLVEPFCSLCKIAHLLTRKHREIVGKREVSQVLLTRSKLNHCGVILDFVEV